MVAIKWPAISQTKNKVYIADKVIPETQKENRRRVFIGNLTLVAGVVVDVESLFSSLPPLLVPEYQVYPVVYMVRYVVAF